MAVVGLHLRANKGKGEEFRLGKFSVLDKDLVSSCAVGTEWKKLRRDLQNQKYENNSTV